MSTTVYRLPAALGSGEAQSEHEGDGSGTITVRLLDGGQPTDTLVALDVKHLTVVKPPLPPEPPVGAVVGNNGSNPRELFVHQPTTGAPELGPDAYYDVFRHVRMDWAGVLRAVSDPVRWVPAPFLAEMIEALRETAPAWHERECGDFNDGPDLEKCTRTECVDWRALLAKVTGEVAA